MVLLRQWLGKGGEYIEDIVLYTPPDIQNIFKCGKKKAYEIMHMAGFPSFRIDTSIYVEKSELQKWLNRNKFKNLNT